MFTEYDTLYVDEVVLAGKLVSSDQNIEPN